MTKHLLAGLTLHDYCPAMNEMTAPPAPRHDTEIKSFRTSHLLRQLILDDPAPKVTLGAILAHLGERAFFFMIFFLAVLNCLPMPPGFSTITGIPILLLAFQLLLGEKRPHLPSRLRNHEIDRGGLAKAVKTILPGLEKFEALFKPRWLWLSTPQGERGVALLILLLTAILVMPMPPPFNFLPAASIAVMALGLSERDGIVISAGGVAGIITLVMVAAFADLIIRILTGMFDYIIGLPGMIFG